MPSDPPLSDSVQDTNPVQAAAEAIEDQISSGSWLDGFDFLPSTDHLSLFFGSIIVVAGVYHIAKRLQRANNNNNAFVPRFVVASQE